MCVIESWVVFEVLVSGAMVVLFMAPGSSVASMSLLTFVPALVSVTLVSVFVPVFVFVMFPVSSSLLSFPSFVPELFPAMVPLFPVPIPPAPAFVPELFPVMVPLFPVPIPPAPAFVPELFPVLTPPAMVALTKALLMMPSHLSFVLTLAVLRE